MKRVSKKINKKALNDYKVIRYLLYFVFAIGFLLLLLGILFSFKDESIDPLNSLILEKKNTCKNAYIDIKFNPILFAEYPNETSKYYIVQDGEFMYIAYLEDKIYKDIINLDLEENSYKIVGYTKRIPNDVKKLAITAYNEVIGKEVITIDNIESYFGNVYLDTNKTINISNILLTFSVIIMGISLFGLVNFRKKFKK
ncbi:MAG: hypothetical protein IJN03_01995 [Bacilli bacterium]|nr:hypothetical protein [Bacilli bacterium]